MHESTHAVVQHTVAGSSEQVRQRLSALQAVTRALSTAVLPVDIGRVVTNEMTAVIGADQSLLAVANEAGTELSLLDQANLQEAGGLVTFSVDAPLPVATSFRTGSSLWLSKEEFCRAFPEIAAASPPQ